MKMLRIGYVTATILGIFWSAVVAICVAISLALLTGAAVTPGLLAVMPAGLIIGILLLITPKTIPARTYILAALFAMLLFAFRLSQPFGITLGEATIMQIFALAAISFGTVGPLKIMLSELPAGTLNRHEFEGSIIKFLTGFGYVFFTVVVAIPFFVMIMTSFKSQQALLLNPLDYSLDLDKGWGLFRSYVELFRDFGFGKYLLTSFFVSVMTVLLTLLFSVPGAYAVARLRFKGQAAMSRSILLIYMVPMIVLALPIYIAFSSVGLRNSIFGILLIYPVTTIPVALYMLQGYFRGLPAEVEEAGLMDGLSRLQVIWKITLPLTRGVAMLNSSEIPRQHLMAGSVIATIPIMLIFLGLEKFMTKGLTAGSVKG